MSAEFDEFDEESSASLGELQGEIIDIDATNLEVYQTPELMTEVLATLASMIGEETGATIYHISGDVSCTKDQPIQEQSGTFSNVLDAQVLEPDGAKDYTVRMHGDWNVAEFETSDEDGEEVPVITRMTIEVTIDSVVPATS
jgi:hypothetical protein